MDFEFCKLTFFKEGAFFHSARFFNGPLRNVIIVSKIFDVNFNLISALGKIMNGPTQKKELKKNSAYAEGGEVHEMEEILKIKATALKKEELDIQVCL